MTAHTRAFFTSNLFSVLSALISIIVLASAMLALWLAVNHSQRSSEHKFCGVLNAMIAAPSQQPKSAYGQALNAAARSLADDLGCHRD
jgi:hypothetical protein